MTEQYSLKRPFALIIEDDDDAAIIFAEALQAAEYETEIIKDGQTALNRLAATTPAMIALDLHLPHISGDKILDTIRTDPRLDQTRVMLVTADARLAQSLRQEADLVLLKPISFSQLRDLSARLRPRDTIFDDF
jgi:CheY-like chemotaxis protein